MTRSPLPAALLQVVQRDLRPVRPLASPARRALALLPLALLVMIGMPLFWNWQARVTLAPQSLWPLSVLESLLSLAVFGAAFREAIPGRELSNRVLMMLSGLALAGFVWVNGVAATPFAAPLETWLQWMRECTFRALVFSLPALLAPTWLVSRALPNRPALTGALCGLGVGVMADAGLRLFCWDGPHSHLLLVHGASIGVLIAIGALSAVMIERLKSHG